MTWVVETGMPKWAVASSTVAAVVSAANPWTGSSSTTRWPIVFMIRQPPTAVPSEMAVAATTMTHHGTSTVGIDPCREQGQGDDAHRLLGVVGAVSEGHVAGRQRPAACGSGGPSACGRVRWNIRAMSDHQHQRAEEPEHG